MGQPQLWAKIRVVQALAHFLVLHNCDVYGGLKLFAQSLREACGRPDVSFSW